MVQVSMPLAWIFILAFIFRFAISFTAWHVDLDRHIDWGIKAWEYGLSSFYTSTVWNVVGPNQPPGTIYMVAGIRKVFEFLFSYLMFLNLNLSFFPSFLIPLLEKSLYPALLKVPAIAADLGIAYLIYKVLKERGQKKLGIWGAVLFLANPVTWYNSAVWGQTDSIINFLSLLAFLSLIKRKLALAISAFALSVYIKASLLIFLPLFLLIIIRQKYGFKTIAKGLLGGIGIIVLLTLPFSAERPLWWLWKLYSDRILLDQLHLLTANAFNLWTVVAHIHAKPDNLNFGPLTYQLWGQILFILSSLPLMRAVYLRQDLKTVLLALSLTALSSFMLLTNMHERYLYPFFPLFTILAVLNKKLLALYLAISLISIINLYNFWWVPRIDPLINLLTFEDRIFTRVFSLLNLLLFLYLYFKAAVGRILLKSKHYEP